MANIFVYSPRTGQNWGQSTYCNQTGNPPHTVVSALGGCCPMDISGSAGGAVTFYGSSLVQSVITRQVSGVCATTGAPWTNGVVVDFYQQLGGRCYIGTVGYGHLTSRVANGTYNVRTLQVGTLPSDCACGCSSGVHVHMQGNGTQTAYACNVTVTGGVSIIFTWPEPTVCRS
jgi:hypothetical protein